MSISDLSMDKYVNRPLPQPQQQPKELADCRRRKAFVEEDGQRSTTFKKMRLHNDTQHLINNYDSNSSFSKGYRSAGTSRSPSPGFDLLAVASNAHKILPYRSPPSKVNWRLACFMAREYLSCGTLLGKPWPPQDSNMRPWEKAVADPRKNLRGDETGSGREAFYSSFTTEVLFSDDVYIPGIVNPSQMAAWLG